MMPKSGAGSEFGREQRELARRKKFGMRIRKYNIHDQPLLLQVNSNKQTRKYKGVRDGGVSENAAYYIFTQSNDGMFEAYNIDDWYHFTPLARYKFLNSDEAEKEFDRRDKTLNYFSIMVKNRIKKDEDGAADGDDKEAAKKKKSAKDKSLTLTEFDEWGDMSGDEDDNSDLDEAEAEEKSKSKKKSIKKEKGLNKRKKKGSDEEASEESDEQDEGNEVDYMSGSSSDDEGMYDEKGRDESEKYEQKGVEDEDGLRKLVNSDDEDEEEDEEKKEDENEDEEEGKVKDDKGSESESSDSDSDSDVDKMENYSSVISLNKKRQQSVVDRKSAVSQETTGSGSRPATPTVVESASKRRKNESPTTMSKKIKQEIKPDVTVTGGAVTSSTSSSNDGITEEVVKRYLQRKLMTTQDLLRKLKPCNSSLSKDELVSSIAQIIKKLNPVQTQIKDKLYFSIKKDA